MENSINQKEIGKRLAAFRKIKGLSQEELAKYVKISRPSLAQIELGNRSIDVMEFKKLSDVLGITFEDLLAKDISVLQEPIPIYEKKEKTERVDRPVLNPDKLINILLYILENCAGKPNVGETVLFKLLYFSDFNYYELYEEHLSGALYRKLPYGPVPQKIDNVLKQMIDNGQLQSIKTSFQGFAQKRYLPLVKADLRSFKASEKDVIDNVLNLMSDWSPTMISEYSYQDLPWQLSEEGKEISYELAFYRVLPYSVRVYNEDNE